SAASAPACWRHRASSRACAWHAPEGSGAHYARRRQRGQRRSTGCRLPASRAASARWVLQSRPRRDVRVPCPTIPSVDAERARAMRRFSTLPFRLLALPLAFALAGCVSLPTPDAREELAAPGITLVTLNLWHDEGD